MKCPVSAIAILFICAWILLQTAASEATYQPECDTLDEAVQQINQAQSQLGDLQGRINCTRSADCDGFTCFLLLQGQRNELRVKLHPCDDPPQMFLLVQDPDTNLPYIQETVTHGDTYTIPGLQYDQAFIDLNVGIQVQFEKVSEGFQIGLKLVLLANGFPLFEIPILSPTLIRTPPCSTQAPGQQSLQCRRMQELVIGLNPPHDFQCVKDDDCKGFRCTGAIGIGPVSFEITAVSVLDSCTEPISYTITIQRNGRDIWSHPFVRSETVPVEGDGITLPEGVQANITVIMDPFTEDIDYFLTTIQLTVHIPGLPQPVVDTFLNESRVPIPPCDHPMTRGPTLTPPASLTPLPGVSDECTTFRDIADDIDNNEVFHGRMNCKANHNPCDGFSCNLTSSGVRYLFKTKMFHCESPVRLLLTIDSETSKNYHVARNITCNAVVPIEELLSGGEIKFLVMRRSNRSVELALTLKGYTPEGTVAIPLVQDRIVPVKPCTLAVPFPDNPNEVCKAASPGPPNNNPVKPPKGGGGEPGKSTQPNSQAATIGAVVGVVAVVMVAAAVVALVWYRRRSHRHNDHIHLVESSDADM
ncbi:uncharacterized protein LOC110975200 [Acanthaster planci]|uniref:Uncharacterized protein LOC110975200 n=1 Tax=Acanthaster planci TaxID=133434 RepID=A0A8B7XQN8_ACAPL|nr:uncharacterized protein LOC110975200 [Acanthaster planci]XP_022083161.1 uncharacterized protein LOC110975200 [Acanthaster planci]